MEAAWEPDSTQPYIKGGRETKKPAAPPPLFSTGNPPQILSLVSPHTPPMGAVGYLTAYLRLHDPAEATASRAALECTAQSVWSSDQKPATTCRAQVAAIGDALDSRTPISTSRTRAVSDILRYSGLERRTDR